MGDWTADGAPERIVGAPVLDLSGETAAFSPDYTVNLDVSYAIDMGGLGTLTPGVLMYHSADFKTMNVPYPFAEQDAYTVFDLRATWYTPIDRLTVQGFIKNATDEEYKVSQTVFSRGRVMADYGVQRNFGIRLGYNF